AYKVKNLRRDPRVALCLLNDGFFGEWGQVEGTAEIVPLPDAMELLVEYYRRVSGEHPDWDDYRNAMQCDQRVIIRFAIERAGPPYRRWRSAVTGAISIPRPSTSSR